LSLLTQLSQLRKEARELEEELVKTKQRLRSSIGHKNDLLEQVKKFNLSISESRKRRDELNIQVKESKLQEEKQLADMQSMRTEIRSRESLVEQYRRRYRMSEEEARRRLNDLEWRLVTEAHNPKRESSLVGEIERLRSIVAAYDRAKAMDKSAERYRSEMARLKEGLNSLRNRRSLLAQQSDEYHRQYIESIETRRAMIRELESARAEIQDLASRKNDVFMKLVECDAKAHLIASSLKMAHDSARLRRETELVDAKAQVAEEVDQKIKSGKPLSLDELRIYYEMKSPS